MGDAMKADGAFIGQDVSVTPLIGKLRLHILGYVGKEDFFISPLKHEDVILGAPWFDRLAASIKFPERKISFKFRENNMYINAQESGSTIPFVNDQAFDKSIKSSIFAYMIFVKGSLNGVNETQVSESGMQEYLQLSNFLNQFQDVFIDDIPRELPPKRGDDDHMIEFILGSSPPNKPPYRVSQAQHEEIMRQVNELVEKGMTKTVYSWPAYRKTEFQRRRSSAYLNSLHTSMSPSVSPVADVVGGLVGEHQLDSGDRQQDTTGHMRVATPPSVRAISGSLGGAIEACCLQPIDSIKTRIQLDTSRQYTGIVSCGKTIVRDEGVRALWKGLTPYSTHLVLKHTMRMGSNAVLLGVLRDPKTGSLSYASRLVAGFGAGIAEALLIVTPCEVIKIRLQQQRGLSSSQLIKYRGPVNCAFTIVHEEGVLGLWAGVAPTLIRNGINQAVMFTAKSTFDRFLWGKYEDDMSTKKKRLKCCGLGAKQFHGRCRERKLTYFLLSHELPMVREASHELLSWACYLSIFEIERRFYTWSITWHSI
ncbi:hypothetical protein L7F22_023139 [Adiantum nelumboides]|nr:hypothetical protein [Adiantum nelumboides]